MADPHKKKWHHTAEARQKISTAVRRRFAERRRSLITDKIPAPSTTSGAPPTDTPLDSVYAGEVDYVTISRQEFEDVKRREYRNGLMHACRMILNAIEGGF